MVSMAAPITLSLCNQCRRNESHIGGLFIVFLLIQYTVIKETYYSLKIIWGGGSSSPSPPGSDGPGNSCLCVMLMFICFKVKWNI